MTLYNEHYMHGVKEFKEAVPEQHTKYKEWHSANRNSKVFDDKTKELIMLAAGIARGCSYCIESHAKKAKAFGATKEEISAVIMLTAQVAAGGAISYGIEALLDEKKE